MKILFVVNNYFATGNGLSASARRTVQALKDAGQDVRVLSGPNPDAAGPRPEYLLQKYNFPIFQPLISAHGYQFAAGDMAKIEEAISWADVVHLEEPFVLDIRAIKVAKKLGKPITGTYHPPSREYLLFHRPGLVEGHQQGSPCNMARLGVRPLLLSSVPHTERAGKARTAQFQIHSGDFLQRPRAR